MKPFRFIENTERFGLRLSVFATMLTLSLFATIAESVGISMALPVAQLMISNQTPAELAKTSELWAYVNQAHAWFGLQTSLASLFLTSAVLICVRQVFVYVREVYFARVKFDLIRNNQVRLLGQYLSCHTGYQESVTVGDFANELVVELPRSVNGLFAYAILANLALQAVVYFGLMLAVSWQMTFAAIALLGCAYVALRGIMDQTEISGGRLTEANRALSSHLIERLSQAHIIKLCGLETAEHAVMQERTLDQKHFNVRVSVLSARVAAMLEPLIAGAGMALVYVGYTVFGLDLAQLGIFLLITLRLMPVYKTIMQTRQAYVANLAALRVILSRLAGLEENQEAGRSTGQKFGGVGTGIELKDVGFHYESTANTAALDRVSTTFSTGKLHALVGPSGSGKSTLADLIPRVREATKGIVLINGRPIEEYELGELRKHIAYSPQSPIMLDVTVEEHIRFGNADATTEEVRAAAELAGALDFIEQKPEGMQTRLGAKGGRFSGGQRQRIDLARALVSNADILILDEPTSSLDADTEFHFRMTLEKIRTQTNLTVIVIGHRFATTRNADRIIVLRDGTIDDVGTHEMLMERDGWYAQAYRKQIG